jgi:tRNA(fMet)-specific endonuclease VapC
MIVADTDVLIDYLADRTPAAGRIALEIQVGGLCATAVSRFELLAGARTERQSRMVHSLLDVLRTLPLDHDAADRAAEVRRDLDRRGEPIGMADSLIAGIVLARGGRLLTRNRGHFERVTGLPLAQL